MSLGRTHITNNKWQEYLTLAFLFCLFVFSFIGHSAKAMQIQGVQIQGDRDNSQVYSGVVYGPIDQNDTLWRIASRYKQDSQFTVYQTMLAIFQLNPQAFENGNFNTMVNGATLQLPSDRYIARIDPRQARAKAERDDQAFGRPNSVRENVNNAEQAANPANNMKPDVPLVNQEDLSKTQAQLQRQLNSLRQQQQQQFQQLKDQVAASINSVEVLLEENKKLNQQLVLIDENNRNLTQAVETELQGQIDQQVEQLAQLIALVKEAEQRRIDQESQSVMQILSSPMAIIIMMGSFTLLVIIGLALVLMRRPAPVAVSENHSKANDIVDDDLVIGEIDDEIDQDSDDLLAALSQDTELEEDDILSDELEEDDALANLDDEILGDELDDMLVPDSKSKSESIEETFDLDELDLESEDGISLDDEEGISLDDEEGISLDDEEGISLDDEISLDQENDSGEQVEQVELAEDLATDASADDAYVPSSINEVEEDDGTPAGIDLDANGEIDENTLEQIGNQIEQKDQTISQMADEILNDLDNVPSDSANVDELIAQEQEESDLIAEEDLISLVDDSEDISIDQDVSESTEADDDSEEIDISDSTESDENELADEISSLSDELLNELSAADEEAEELDALLDAELEDTVSSALSDDDLMTSPAEASTDEVIEKAFDEEELDDEVLDLSDDSDIDAEQTLENDQVAALADELLQELESEESQSDELDELLAEIDEENADNLDAASGDTESAALDPDDLLDDIPSFTNDITSQDVDDIEHEDTVKDNEVAFSEEANLEPESEPESAEIPVEISEDKTEEDVLASLPDLDNWLDDDEDTEANQKLAEDIAQMSKKDDELDLSALDLDIDDIDVLGDNDTDTDESALMQELDDTNFDDMLLDLSDDDETSGQEAAAEQYIESTDDTSPDVLGQAGLDIDALMDESEQDSGTTDNAFVDVDELLKESNALPEMTDDEKTLDLSASLNNLDDSDMDDGQIAQSDQQQASNLDLAQVYIDMGDDDAAKELLEEVIAQGTDEQKSEALVLLETMN